MLFNSLDFLLFFFIVLTVYWAIPRRLQNFWLLACSYFFYGFWHWQFLGLILLSTSVDFVCGHAIYKAHRENNKLNAQTWMWASVITNLGILISFKFHGFFLDELTGSYATNRYSSVDIIVPIGISFYTFQTMSYTFDVYRKKITPVRSFFDFALFVSFFPQLMAGPIERAGQLLPQIQSNRKIDGERIITSLLLIIWGFFHKVVIADNFFPFVTSYYDHPFEASTSIFLLSSYALAFHVYCDFAGYCYMAMGIAGLLGFQLSENFRNPFFSATPQEFWAKWHVTLADWFRSYMLFPLSRYMARFMSKAVASSLSQTLVILAFAVWHGFEWTFVAWGGIQAALYQLYRVGQKVISPEILKYIPRLLGPVIWFNIFAITGCFYRMRDFEDLSLHWSNLTRGFLWDGGDILVTLVTFIPFLLWVESLHHDKKHQYFFSKLSIDSRVAIGLVFYTIVLFCGAPSSISFIYFQF